MSGPQQRKDLLQLIERACTDGARLARACVQIGLSERTVQRWQRPDAQDGDRRVSGLHERTEPPNKLSAFERQAAMALLNGEEFKDLPPSQIVPRLADQGRYIASESTLYRLLHLAGQMHHRRLERAPQKRSKPRALTATGPIKSTAGTSAVSGWLSHLEQMRSRPELSRAVQPPSVCRLTE